MNNTANNIESVSTNYTGHIVDVVGRRIFDGRFTVEHGRITSVEECEVAADAPYYMPGFIDSHVHVESSMMTPPEFARIASCHGTVGAVCDPHEIANVLGKAGVEMMCSLGQLARFRFAFGVPSCVPSCNPEIETSGYTLDADAVAELLKRDDIYFLAEMMNFPGVLGGDPQVMAKIKASLACGKPVDGHAPGLLGEVRKQYADAGISTDHECTTLEEGRDAVKCGMIVQIRQGSAAKDYNALAPLISEAPGQVMFCTDDSHPTDFINSHIDRIVRRAIADGYDIMDILTAACATPMRHYNIPSGLLQVGDVADFIAVTDLTPNFRVLDTYVDGVNIYSSTGLFISSLLNDKSARLAEIMNDENVNKFNASMITEEDIARTPGDEEHIIVATDGSLLTTHEVGPVTEDVQKMVVLDRYTPGAKPVVAYIKGFDIQKGAFAQSIAHDCHNIIAVGSDDKYLVQTINKVIEMTGGIAVTDGYNSDQLPLPIGGLMSMLCGYELAVRNQRLEKIVEDAGCPFNSPFITLGFMALPVIPQIKLTDKGLFDGNKFQFIKQ